MRTNGSRTAASLKTKKINSERAQNEQFQEELMRTNGSRTAAELKAGFARADITPPLGVYIQGYYEARYGSGILDRLTASCAAFSDGEKTAVVITLDLIGMSMARGNELRSVVAEKTGLPFNAVFFACTHTHTGPKVNHFADGGHDKAYNSILYRKCADIAAEAIADLSPAEMYLNRGKAENLSFIRRFRMKDGSTRTNPGIGNPDIDCPISQPDDELQLMRIVREGRDDIVIINFQCHADTIGGDKYSSDWPGFVRRSFEGAVPGTKCLFFNGAEGDTNHYNVFAPAYRTAKGYKHAQHMGLSVAGEAMKLYTYAEKSEGTKVDFAQVDIEVPSNRGKPEDISTAEKYIALHEAGKHSEIPYSGMEYTTVIAEAYRIKRLENGPDSFMLNLNAVRVGNAAFLGVPGEPFTDIGLEIKEKSPFKMTIVCSDANGDDAYYPSKAAYAEGGYEARSSEFAAGVAEMITDNSIEMLNSIY